MPDGARAGDAVAIGTVIVTLGSGVLALLARTLQAWIVRGGGRTVVLEVDGDRIELEGASEQDQRRLVDTFVARHGPEDG